MYFSRYCVRKLTKKLEIKVLKAIKAYMKCKQLVAKLFLLNAITCKQAAYEIYCIYTFLQYNTVRMNVILKYSISNNYLYYSIYC